MLEFPTGINFAVSSICHAFKSECIGSKVLDKDIFLDGVEAAIEAHDATQDAIPGQMFLSLPDTVNRAVSPGVGMPSAFAEDCDFVVREHRGRFNAYLRRRRAIVAPYPVSAVVYTRDAYLADPEVDEEEAENIGPDATHVIVAVLSGPRAELTPERFVSNLAGGNREAATWDLSTILDKAESINEFWNEWCLVAD
tara:strand:+ start:23102 stop:23689 length:588 start_codon:yes stop_codon:yes gene_type:complete